jgi:hypothetical protein
VFIKRKPAPANFGVHIDPIPYKMLPDSRSPLASLNQAPPSARPDFFELLVLRLKRLTCHSASGPSITAPVYEPVVAVVEKTTGWLRRMND